jgi:hypothetical protein
LLKPVTASVDFVKVDNGVVSTTVSSVRIGLSLETKFAIDDGADEDLFAVEELATTFDPPPSDRPDECF